MSRRRAWHEDASRHYAGRPAIVRRLCYRPGWTGRYTWRGWHNMTPEQLSKSGSEHGHQRALFSEVLKWSPLVYDMMFAIPNGGARGNDSQTAKIRGANLKAEGVKRGVPDVLLAWPFGAYAGLFIEMKRPADREKDRAAGRLGKGQEPWHDRLRERGYAVVIAYTWEEAFKAVKAYFGVA